MIYQINIPQEAVLQLEYKLHIIVDGYYRWHKHIEKIKSGEASLQICTIAGLIDETYKVINIEKELDADSDIGIEKLRITDDYTAHIYGFNHPFDEIISNNLNTSAGIIPGDNKAIIHFTDIRYYKKL